MCHNVVEGRLYEGCGHFQAMNTERADCRNKACVFSGSHTPGCRNPACNKFMTIPENKPIRQSPRECPDCAQRTRMASMPVPYR
ncbi:hypothetical protein RSOLAG22IIIB_03957 [Rhizoctonia solani]|uniref:Uncharacterized protein n=1 Tax=Rhizoctonia solani TaxID=456999 RepID=A0A0K6FT56_9AGAM|nr:hypothetical protein RSOLAG22IIIB_03957 [Rhizoctonia solani]